MFCDVFSVAEVASGGRNDRLAVCPKGRSLGATLFDVYAALLAQPHELPQELPDDFLLSGFLLSDFLAELLYP